MGYEWRTEMERKITQQIYFTKDTNIFMKAAVDPDVLEQTFLQEIKEIEEEDKEGVENLNKDNDEWSSNQIKMKKTQLIFFYLKTAKKGMLNILNQCQDKNYVAYCTFYTPPRTQTSTIRYTSEDNEEESSDDELTDFMEGQLEATLFYLETPSNARELAGEIAKIALNQLKEKLNKKKKKK